MALTSGVRRKRQHGQQAWRRCVVGQMRCRGGSLRRPVEGSCLTAGEYARTLSHRAISQMLASYDAKRNPCIRAGNGQRATGNGSRQRQSKPRRKPAKLPSTTAAAGTGSAGAPDCYRRDHPPCHKLHIHPVAARSALTLCEKNDYQVRRLSRCPRVPPSSLVAVHYQRAGNAAAVKARRSLPPTLKSRLNWSLPHTPTHVLYNASRVRVARMGTGCKACFTNQEIVLAPSSHAVRSYAGRPKRIFSYEI